MKLTRTFLTVLTVLSLTLSVFSVTSFAAEAQWLWPVSGTNTSAVTQYFGSHEGLDIGAAVGTSVVASKSGTVVRAYTGCKNFSAYSNTRCTEKGICSPNAGYWDGTCNAGYGNGVVIDHGDGTFSHYAHLSAVAIPLGTYVTQGQLIGTLGSSGASYGPHLHFALAYNANGSGGRFNNNPSALSYIFSVNTTPAAASITIESGSDKYYIGETNAVVCGTINNPAGGTISTAGFILYDAKGNTLHTYTENCHPNYVNRTSVPMTINFNEEAGISLKPGVSYSYELYAYINGQIVVSEKVAFTAAGYLLGDVNRDGDVTAADALTALQHAVGKITLNAGYSSADVTKDGFIRAEDALLILQFAVGKISSF